MSYLKKFKHRARKMFHRAKDWAHKSRRLTTILKSVSHKHPILAVLHKAARMKGHGRKYMGGRRARSIGQYTIGEKYSAQFVNRNAAPPMYRVAYGIDPKAIPKLSVDMFHKNNPLGLGANWKE